MVFKTCKVLLSDFMINSDATSTTEGWLGTKDSRVYIGEELVLNLNVNELISRFEYHESHVETTFDGANNE